MNEQDLAFLSNDRFPEAIRVSYLDGLLKKEEISSANALELEKLGLERRKFYWNTPLVAAAAGLLTLSATAGFDLVSGTQEANNVVTLEQIKSELEKSEARVTQQLEERSARSAAEIGALAREREFQYEIVKMELANQRKTNSERAAVLLFLAKAGVLSALHTDALQAMAEEQIQKPNEAIIPQLSANQSVDPASLLWEENQIPVCWENSEPRWKKYMELVEHSVNDTWEANSRLDFVGWSECQPTTKAVRMRIADEGPHTKALGKQLLGRAAGVVINFEFKNWSPSCQNKPEECIRALAVHDFGHVIGFGHEQNRPDAPPECAALRQGSDSVIVGPYDPYSVMNYCNPEFYNGGELSELDVMKLHLLYGSRAAPWQVLGGTPDLPMPEKGIAERGPATDRADPQRTLFAINPGQRGVIDNRSFPLMAAKWPSNVVFVCWENPTVTDERERRIVREAISQTWAKFSRLEFTGWQQCATGSTGVRILIKDEGPHVKYLGKYLAYDGSGKSRIVRDGMVLNFTFDRWSPSCKPARENCISSIAVHEFGHVIGFAHEQSRFDSPGECDKVTQKASAALLTPWDPYSVMNYCNPSYNNDGQLSPFDIKAVEYIYGAR